MEPVNNIIVIKILNRIFDNSMNLFALIAPNGWRFSEYISVKYQQDDLKNFSETQEFQHVLGLTVYDTFSNNHEVYNKDSEVYDLGSFRGTGSFIADFLNNKDPENNNFIYLDFYMGSIWLNRQANLLPFYEYIFQILKNEDCDWNYCFPRLYLLDMSGKGIEKLQNELDLSFQNEYEDAKYKSLIPIVQAYKNIYKRLPMGHPQKEFE